MIKTQNVKRTSFSNKYRFFLLLSIAVIISYIPIISLPFNWLESFFHELSHGLAALLTGGKIISIQLFPNGAGLCTTQGGSRFVISFMGYTGAIFWGALIYLLAWLNKKAVQVVSLAILLLLALSVLFWVRDVLTIILVSVLMGLFFLKWKIDIKYLSVLMQLTGLLILLNAVLSPLHLIDGRHIGDGASLALLTGIPEIIWVVIWSLLGSFVLFKLGKRS
jgi:hypothetical protein